MSCYHSKEIGLESGKDQLQNQKYSENLCTCICTHISSNVHTTLTRTKGSVMHTEEARNFMFSLECQYSLSIRCDQSFGNKISTTMTATLLYFQIKIKRILKFGYAFFCCAYIQDIINNVRNFKIRYYFVIMTVIINIQLFLVSCAVDFVCY